MASLTSEAPEGGAADGVRDRGTPGPHYNPNPQDVNALAEHLRERFDYLLNAECAAAIARTVLEYYEDI